jgi:Fe-S oxidoreductase
VNPWLITLLLTSGWGYFAFQLYGAIRLLSAKAAPQSFESPPGPRFRRLLIEGIGQLRLHRYRAAGLAHHVIFVGFLVLLLRTLILWGRGYFPAFHGFWFAPTADRIWSLGNGYQFLRETCAILVLAGTGYFFYLRLVRREKRLTLSHEALVILGLIVVMMLADLTYDACGELLASRFREGQVFYLVGSSRKRLLLFIAPFLSAPTNGSALLSPGSSALASAFAGLSSETMLLLGQLGYYLHAALVLVFLNLLPSSKHFHVLTALPNLYLSPTGHEGRLSVMASSAEQLLAKVEAAFDQGQLDAVAIGKATVEHWSKKDRLDWFACTECGRCEDHCPAHRTGKVLSPKQLTLALRDQLKRERQRLLGKAEASALPLVPDVISAEALWACTTCRACEEQCPVRVNYIESIVGLRRNLVMMRGEVAASLQRVFDGMERNGNPWNFPKYERAAWASGLDVRELKDVEHVEYLFWVGCAASYDDRAKSVARAFVRLMQRAKVSFAILGEEERCTGDSARRAGNELLFLQLADENIQTLKKYLAENRFERIVTICPHCLSTLSRDYADLGAEFEVVHHSVALERWVAAGRLIVNEPVPERTTFHDPCTLARHSDSIIEPRRLLRKILREIPIEPEHHGRQTLCCGAGGAQMWLEEQNKTRMNVHRAKELAATRAERVISACPFCLTMITDGVAALGDSVRLPVEDLAELLERVTNGSSTN